jgi:hypothetical protein
MNREREQISPNRPADAEAEVALTSRKSVKPRPVSEALNVDELLSKDAEEFLRRNQQKGGQ